MSRPYTFGNAISGCNITDNRLAYVMDQSHANALVVIEAAILNERKTRHFWPLSNTTLYLGQEHTDDCHAPHVGADTLGTLHSMQNPARTWQVLEALNGVEEGENRVHD